MRNSKTIKSVNGEINYNLQLKSHLLGDVTPGRPCGTMWMPLGGSKSENKKSITRPKTACRRSQPAADVIGRLHRQSRSSAEKRLQGGCLQAKIVCRERSSAGCQRLQGKIVCRLQIVCRVSLIEIVCSLYQKRSAGSNERASLQNVPNEVCRVS